MEEAGQLCDVGGCQLGSPYHLAVGLLDHADYLVAIGEFPTAQQLAAEAATIAERLGAKR